MNMILHGDQKRAAGSVMASGICITALVALLYLFKPGFLDLLELKLYDTQLQSAHSPVQTGRVAIVDIDEKSLRTIGQWPWPRYRVAQLFNEINSAGVRAVGLDILFSEPDRTSPIVMKSMMKKELDIDVQLAHIPEHLRNYDTLLGDALGKNTAVLGFTAVFSDPSIKEGRVYLPEIKLSQHRQKGAAPASVYLPQAKALIQPLPELLKNCRHTGFMNAVPDRDGVVRKCPLMISFKDRIYPQLALATLLAAAEEGPGDLMVRVTAQGIESLDIGGIEIPLDEHGAMQINFRGPSRTFPYISAADVLLHRVDPAELKDKYIFVGASASGLKDIRITPLDQVFPGVEVHATLIDNILSRDFIRRPAWATGLELVVILLWGAVTTVLIGCAGAALTIPVTLGLGVMAWYGSAWALESLHFCISPLFPIITLLLNVSILNIQKFKISEQRKNFFKNAFSKYVSTSVVDQLARHPDRLSLTGEEKQVSILFSDIRNFTGISEKLSPSQLIVLLNDYFTMATTIIINNFGTHDKFIGDAVMSFWNAPVDVKDHEKHALNAALEMIKGLSDLNKKFQQQFDITISVGIGLHSGACRVGNMGSKDIFDYTIIGDNVNLASRLEGLTKFYGVPLIISQQMLNGLSSDQIAVELDLVRVKGKNRPVRIYTVYSKNDSQPSIGLSEKEIQGFQDGLQLYQRRRFKEGAAHFQQMTEAWPEPKLYSIYLQRCRILQSNPPPKEWDGVFTHTIK